MVNLYINCGEFSRELSMLEIWTQVGGSYKNKSSRKASKDENWSNLSRDR
jgi:hypothetical protein